MEAYEATHKGPYTEFMPSKCLVMSTTSTSHQLNPDAQALPLPLIPSRYRVFNLCEDLGCLPPTRPQCLSLFSSPHVSLTTEMPLPSFFLTWAPRRWHSSGQSIFYFPGQNCHIMIRSLIPLKCLCSLLKIARN